MGAVKNFYLHVYKQDAQAFLIRAEFDGANREQTISADLPHLEAEEIKQAPTWLHKGQFDEPKARRFGEHLFQSIFPAEIRQFFWSAYRSVKEPDRLRLLICFPMPAPLNHLPWELLYTPESGLGFLGRSPRLYLARLYKEMPISTHAFKGRLLNVLVVSAEPAGYPPISAEVEVQSVTEPLRKTTSLGDFIKLLLRNLARFTSLKELAGHVRNRMRFRVKDQPAITQPDLDHLLNQAESEGDPFHVIHFIGHGDRDGLLLEPEQGGDGWLPAGEFAEIVGREATLLVVLSACESASGAQFVESTARAVLKKGVPAVIGMQAPVLDIVTVEFFKEFYTAWASGQPLEGAIAAARRLAPETGAAAETDWGIPTLYLGTSEALIAQSAGQAPMWLRAPLWFLQTGWKGIFTLAGLLGVIGVFLAFPDQARQIRMSIEPLRCNRPVPMEGTFNVAFSPFVVMDETGRIEKGAQGKALAITLYKNIEASLEGIDSLSGGIEARGPRQTCTVTGATSDELRLSAAELASRMSANILIYGVIHTGKGLPELELEFTISSEGFKENPEIAGNHALGRSLPYDAGRDPGLSGSVISQRSLILSQIIKGLAYYAADHYSPALEYFQMAADNPTWWSSDGKESIYLMIGNTIQRQAGCNLDASLLPDASDAYAQALAIRDDFLRAKAGKAATTYLLSLNDTSKLPGGCPEAGLYQDYVDTELLYQSQEEFEDLLAEVSSQAADSENSRALIPKLHTGLGTIYLVRYMTDGDPHWLDDSRSAYQEAIRLGEGQPAADFHVGQAHAMLGTLAECEGDVQQAKANYTQAAVRMSPAYNALYSASLGEIYCREDNLDGAVQAYKNAVANCGLASENECVYFFRNCDQYNTRWKELLRYQAEELETCGPK